MPTIVETLQAIRDDATINAAALDSVKVQAGATVAEVEGWPNAPSKGHMRDQLHRLQGCYERARQCALSTASMTTRIIALVGVDPGPGPGPTPLTWSTGNW